MRRRRSQAQKYPIKPRVSKPAQPVSLSLLLGMVSIKWPQACKTTVWEQFNEDKVLEASVKGEVDRRLQVITIITSLAPEKFGEVQLSL